MTRTRFFLANVSTCALGLAVLVGCNDPFPPDTSSHTLEDCAASTEWLMDSGGAYQSTPALTLFNPAPHPTTECPFYRGGWQNFLIATQPTDAAGTPAFTTPVYSTIDTLFSPKIAHGPNRSYLGDIKQAGKREIVVDQNGRTLYYSIEVNQTYADFIHANALETSTALQAYPSDKTKKNLFFPAGVVEIKAAWQVVDGDAATIADQTKDYISMVTSIPTMHTITDPVSKATSIEENRDEPIANVTVRMVAMHVVYSYPGHPELIWASFEHTTGSPDAGTKDNHRNAAPTLEGKNPASTDPNNTNVNDIVSGLDTYLLYKAGTPANHANSSISEDCSSSPDNCLHLDDKQQKFIDPTTMLPQQTSIYRMFPASKSNTVDADDAVTSLNNNVEALFNKADAASIIPANDKRRFYRLLGGQWMDKPDYFHNDFPIQNDASSPFAQPPASGTVGIGKDAFTKAIETDGSDSPFSILAGEDRMSSTSMESFTQYASSFPNCFQCHNTRAIDAHGTPLNSDQTSVKLLDPGLLNVSHVISQFVLEDCGTKIVTDSNGSHADCTMP